MRGGCYGEAERYCAKRKEPKEREIPRLQRRLSVKGCCMQSILVVVLWVNDGCLQAGVVEALSRQRFP